MNLSFEDDFTEEEDDFAFEDDFIEEADDFAKEDEPPPKKEMYVECPRCETIFDANVFEVGSLKAQCPACRYIFNPYPFKTPIRFAKPMPLKKEHDSHEDDMDLLWRKDRGRIHDMDESDEEEGYGEEELFTSYDDVNDFIDPEWFDTD